MSKQYVAPMTHTPNTVEYWGKAKDSKTFERIAVHTASLKSLWEYESKHPKNQVIDISTYSWTSSNGHKWKLKQV